MATLDVFPIYSPPKILYHIYHGGYSMKTAK
nr:MAG TPA: hypothetical protein [Caudoviricetes sp.]